jgi:stearoyl-CoA desaturase (delta-9 desaturase)
MAFLDRVLDPPSYGYTREQKLYKPTQKEIYKEFFHRLNLFNSRRSWLPFFSWLLILMFAPFFFLFLFKYFTWKLLVVGFIYSMVILGTHGTIYLHRYGSHNAFTFKNKFWLFFTRSLVVKTIPEEAYVISHHVHHYLSEKPGDPYNVHGGWLYCFLADVNHQAISRELSPDDYAKTANMIAHMGVHVNSYAQYQKWGSVTHPFWTILDFASNWIFWFSIFYLLGGMPLLATLIGWTAFWAVGVRTFNYDGHGGGKDKRRDGVDFNRLDLSINQKWPGLVTGEWHNNHHLYPNGARAGFLPSQWDYAWLYIKALHKIGAINQYRDFKSQFLEKYYQPWLAQQASTLSTARVP